MSHFDNTGTQPSRDSTPGNRQPIGVRRRRIYLSWIPAPRAYSQQFTQEKLLVLPNVVFREVDERTLEAVLAVTLAPEQLTYVGTVSEALDEAREVPEGKPWYRAVFDGELAVGFVMLSWNVQPSPPEIIGPWYLWKLIVDRRYQGRGYGRAIINRVVETVRAEGAETLLTSYALGPDNPGPFYQHVGFIPTGGVNIDGEIIVALKL
jgi:diamine N-acetyltransferase